MKLTPPLKSHISYLILFFAIFLTAAAPAAHIESLSIRALPMRDLAELLTRATDISVVVSRGAADVPVSTYLQNHSALAMLESICRAAGLWYRQQPSGIYEILTLEELRATARIHHDDHVKVIPILYPAAQDVATTLHNMYPDRVVWTKPADDFGDRHDSIERALARMDQLASRAQFSLDGGTSSSTSRDTRNTYRESRIPQHASRNTHPASSTAGTPTRIQPHQDEEHFQTLRRGISPEELELIQRDNKSLWDISGEMGFVYIAAFPGPNQILLRSTDPKALETIERVIRELDRVTPQVLLEVKVLEVALADGFESGIDWLFKQDLLDPAAQVSGGFSYGLPGSSRGAEIRGTDLSLLPQGTGLDPRAIVFNFISENLRLRLQMLETHNRVTQLAAPTLTVADEEASIVFIGDETTIPISLDTRSNYNVEGAYVGTDYTLNTERRNIGDTLLITPKLHADRTVTLRILHENSQLGNRQQFHYGHNRSHVFESQDVNKRTVASTVVASDGNLVAIGGLIRERATTQQEGIPFLQSIPALGTLFRRDVQRRERSELIVLIVPYILVAPGEGEAATRHYLDSASQHPTARDPAATPFDIPFRATNHNPSPPAPALQTDDIHAPVGF